MRFRAGVEFDARQEQGRSRPPRRPTRQKRCTHGVSAEACALKYRADSTNRAGGGFPSDCETKASSAAEPSRHSLALFRALSDRPRSGARSRLVSATPPSPVVRPSPASAKTRHTRENEG